MEGKLHGARSKNWGMSGQQKEVACFMMDMENLWHTGLIRPGTDPSLVCKAASSKSCPPLPLLMSYLTSSVGQTEMCLPAYSWLFLVKGGWLPASRAHWDDIGTELSIENSLAQPTPAESRAWCSNRCYFKPAGICCTREFSTELPHTDDPCQK